MADCLNSDLTHSARYRSLISDLNTLNLNIANSCEDIDQSFFESTNCKYYNCQEFNTLTSFSKCNFSAFNLNIASFSRHYDELNALLGLLNFNFSVIGISETKFLKHSPPNFNFSLEGYSVEQTPTESSAGGTLLYISNRYAYIPRLDLANMMYASRELESVFVEISFSQKSNFIVGCIYKHPGMSVNLFNSEFLSPLLQRVSRENKTLILLGDFNIDLMKYNTNQDVSNFLDILGSHLIIPQVILPTRITETSKTIIDNIFSTVTGNNCTSGNLLHSI